MKLPGMLSPSPNRSKAIRLDDSTELKFMPTDLRLSSSLLDNDVKLLRDVMRKKTLHRD